MLLLKLFRYLFGYVRLSARGGFPERFVNLCANGSVNLWDLISRDGVIYASTDINSYKKIRPAARKSGMRVRIESRNGLPFFFAKHKRRMGFLLGVVVFGLVILSLSTRIWSVNVQGNVEVSSQEIISVFEGLGVKSGVSINNVDIDEVEKLALRQLSGLSWLNINISGSSALIEVREIVKTPERDTDNTPSDIVALRDGQLVILRVFSGTAQCKTGGAVLRGDLLISGTEEYKDGSVEFCRAKGYAVARTRRKLSEKAGAGDELKLCARVRRRWSLGFLMFDIPLGRLSPPKGTLRYADTSGIKIKKTILPVSLTEYSYYTQSDYASMLTQGEKRLMALSDFFEEYAAQFRYLTVESQEITVVSNKAGSVVDGSFTCLENIGQSKAIEIEQLPQGSGQVTVN